jgi:hypothetical protein
VSETSGTVLDAKCALTSRSCTGVRPYAVSMGPRDGFKADCWHTPSDVVISQSNRDLGETFFLNLYLERMGNRLFLICNKNQVHPSSDCRDTAYL